MAFIEDILLPALFVLFPLVILYLLAMGAWGSASVIVCIFAGMVLVSLVCARKENERLQMMQAPRILPE
jgi:hypothetical protein